MNLTDYRQTPVHQVVEMIRREAERYGVAVVESEIVGLIPNEALVEAATFYLQLGGFSSHQILENRLADLIQQG
jgi:glutamate formiminotransferase